MKYVIITLMFPICGRAGMAGYRGS